MGQGRTGGDGAQVKIINNPYKRKIQKAGTIKSIVQSELHKIKQGMVK